MCTLSFIPTERGYLVAMNRDEQISRETALPPQIFGDALYPRDPGGSGTWIGVNSFGITLALLNRNLSGTPHAKLRSRGDVIPALVGSSSLPEIQRSLVDLD